MNKNEHYYTYNYEDRKNSQRVINHYKFTLTINHQ